MSKHTPGPWHYSTKPQPNGCPIIGADGLMIAMLAHSVNIPGQCDTAIANARLISAAPDLLEALIKVVEISDRKHEAWDAAKAAIAKATGREVA